MKTKTRHTPTPWSYDWFDGHGYLLGPKKKVRTGPYRMPIYLAEITARDSERLVASPSEQKANLAYIVKIVNCHEELVQGLEDIRSWIRTGYINDVKYDEASILDEIKRLLTKAKEA
ncbi:MAG: hypothetical protein HY548_09330 [Elusimicrobia bacterium]|nr:hypothetical protein [Elusimicrobiota bacterium]